MLEISSKSAENQTEVFVASPEAIAMEMTAIVREAAEPSVLGEHIAAAIDRAARRLGLSYRRAKAYWYQETRLVPAHEADKLRRARRQMMRDRAARLNAELATLQLRLSALDGDP